MRDALGCESRGFIQHMYDLTDQHSLIKNRIYTRPTRPIFKSGINHVYKTGINLEVEVYTPKIKALIL